MVSATAPLSAQLAQDIEARCNAPLMEIYGSTETGQIASRRSTQTAQWRLFPGIRLIVEGDSVRACGGHIETPIAMNDLIEPITDELFLLHGRIADLVNIAGKRHSLASLNHLLNAIPGVVDGAFYMPDETSTEPCHTACRVRGGTRNGGRHTCWRRYANISTRFSCRAHCCLWMHCRATARENCRAQRCKRCYSRAAHRNPHE